MLRSFNWCRYSRKLGSFYWVILIIDCDLPFIESVSYQIGKRDPWVLLGNYEVGTDYIAWFSILFSVFCIGVGWGINGWKVCVVKKCCISCLSKENETGGANYCES